MIAVFVNNCKASSGSASLDALSAVAELSSLWPSDRAAAGDVSQWDNRDHSFPFIAHINSFSCSDVDFFPFRMLRGFLAIRKAKHPKILFAKYFNSSAMLL